ncbi:MAG: UMP kinase [Nanoarchaeota archaeon]
MISVISLSGSMIFDSALRIDYLKRFKKVVLDHVRKGNRVVIVTGGGGLNRLYNAAAKGLCEPSDTNLDWLGIAVTRVNATLVKTMFGELAYEDIITNPLQVPATDKPILVASGYKPGFSTDWDAVMLAKHFGAGIINLTNVDYVYDKNPRQFKEAKPLKKLSWDGLQQLVGTEWTPRLNMPFDPIAVKEAKKAGLHLAIINGNRLERLEAALQGKAVEGTVVN